MFFSTLFKRTVPVTVKRVNIINCFSATTKRFTSNASTAATAAAESSGKEVNHWKYERLASGLLLPLTLYPLIAGPSKAVDLFLTFTLPIHCHFGFQQIITDYLNVRKIGGLNKVVVGALYLTTLVSIYGLFLFNTRDVGITQFIANCWNAKAVVAAKKEDGK